MSLLTKQLLMSLSEYKGRKTLNDHINLVSAAVNANVKCTIKNSIYVEEAS